MKNFLSLAVVGLLFAGDYNIGVGFGRHNVSNSPINNYNFFNVRAGKYLPKNHILRAELERSEKVNNEHITRALLNVEHYFNTNLFIAPYVFVGAGYQWVSGKYKNEVVADLGAGFNIRLYKNLDAFLELRGVRDFGNNDNHYGVIFGLSYNFKEKDLKNLKDSDNDGVIDLLDKCPNTPENIAVDKKGCALDDDKDGVPNYLDKCPNTPNGFNVNQEGCPITFNFDIKFDTAKAEVKPEYEKKLREFANFLKENPKYKVRIEGYTDNVGNEEDNLKLSEKRAKAIYEELIKLGISEDKLSYKGYGEANPIASNDTKEGRAKNRRVIAVLYY